MAIWVVSTIMYKAGNEGETTVHKYYYQIARCLDGESFVTPHGENIIDSRFWVFSTKKAAQDFYEEEQICPTFSLIGREPIIRNHSRYL